MHVLHGVITNGDEEKFWRFKEKLFCTIYSPIYIYIKYTEPEMIHKIGFLDKWIIEKRNPILFLKSTEGRGTYSRTERNNTAPNVNG